MGNEYGGGPDWSNPWGPMSAMMTPWMQMFRMWSEGMQAFVPNGANAASAWTNPFMPRNGARNATPDTRAPKVAVLLASQRPAEVTVDLQPGADLQTLSAEPLAHTDADVPALSGISLECEPGLVRVRVTIPTDQPGGSYVGAVQDGRGTSQGQIAVNLE